MYKVYGGLNRTDKLINLVGKITNKHTGKYTICRQCWVLGLNQNRKPSSFFLPRWGEHCVHGSLGRLLCGGDFWAKNQMVRSQQIFLDLDKWAHGNLEKSGVCWAYFHQETPGFRCVLWLAELDFGTQLWGFLLLSQEGWLFAQWAPEALLRFCPSGEQHFSVVYSWALLRVRAIWITVAINILVMWELCNYTSVGSSAQIWNSSQCRSKIRLIWLPSL